MLSLARKERFWDEKREIGVYGTSLLEHGVELMLHFLPNSITVRFDDHTAAHAGVVNQFGFFDHVGIPLSEVGIHGGDLLYHFFFCHTIIQPFDACAVRRAILR